MQKYKEGNSSELEQNNAKQIIIVTTVLSLIYVVVRYHIAGGVPWKDFPFFILNKAISLSAFILLVINFSLGPLINLGVKLPEGWLNSRSVLGIFSFMLVILHTFMSLMLFSPRIYSKFFEADGTLTFSAGMSMLGGIIALLVLWIYNLSFKTHLRDNERLISFLTSRKFLLTAILFGGIHLFFMGYGGWMNPSGWHGGIPPVSLVAFVFFVFGYVVNLFGRE